LKLNCSFPSNAEFKNMLRSSSSPPYIIMM
jgi:hypothetical protein